MLTIFHFEARDVSGAPHPTHIQDKNSATHILELPYSNCFYSHKGPIKQLVLPIRLDRCADQLHLITCFAHVVLACAARCATATALLCLLLNWSGTVPETCRRDACRASLRQTVPREAARQAPLLHRSTSSPRWPVGLTLEALRSATRVLP